LKQLHIIWDYDGTLYDTYPQMTLALMAALRGFGQDASYAEAYSLLKKTVFYGVSVYAARYQIPAGALLAAFRTYHAQQRDYPPMEGMRECLRETAGLGCRHYLFTHRDQQAKDRLAADGLLDLFTDAITRNDGFADKPSPEALLHLMNRYQFDASDAMMIGDRDIDLAAARAGAIAGVLFDPEDAYPDVLADARVRHMREITKLVRHQLAAL